MGKKGSWISAIKRAFSSNSKDQPTTVHVEKKKWAFGNTKKNDINSLIPIYREPSSIEEILGDAERDTTDHEPYKVQPYQLPQRRRSVEQESDRYRTSSYQSGSNRRSVEHEKDRYRDSSYQSGFNRRSVEQERDRHRTSSYQSGSNRRRSVEHERDSYHINQNYNRVQQITSDRFNDITDQNVEVQNNLGQKAPKTQLNSKWVHPPRPKINKNVAHKSAIKIQTAFRGYLARRNYRALKGLIRLQGMMRGQSVKYQTMNTMKCMQIFVKVQSQIRARRLEMMENSDYNSRQINNKDTDNIFGLWNTKTSSRGDDSWNDSVLTKEEAEARMRKKVEAVMKRERALAYAYSHQLLKATPATASAILADLHSGTDQWCWTPVPDEPTRYQTNLKPKLKLPIQTQLKPISSKPEFKPKPKPNFTIKDDESLTSCPPFSVPNYMAQTVSAKAKIRARALEKQNEKKRFNLGQSIGSIKWGKGYFWKDLNKSEKEIGRKHRSTLSVGSGFSIDSAVSMPVVVGRRPFK